MTLPIYPTYIGLAFPMRWTLQMFNMPSAVSVSGASIDLGLSTFPRHTFELTYEFLRDFTTPREFLTLQTFFIGIGGKVGRFLFNNTDDNARTAQVLATTDGATALYGPIPRAATAGLPEPVGVVNTGVTFNLYLNGTLQSASTYDVVTASPCNQNISFHSVPGAGQVITLDFGFYYYCQFVDDKLDFDKFFDKYWTTKVVIQSCRLGA